MKHLMELLREWGGILRSTIAMCALAPLAAAANVAVENAWVRAMPPGQSVTALYFEVVNHSDEACTLTAISTPAAPRTELHRTIEEDGMARMRLQESVTIEPHSTLQLAPGADHVMLYDVVDRLEPGAQIAAEVDFGACGQVAIEAEVRDATGSSQAHHGHHHHH